MAPRALRSYVRISRSAPAWFLRLLTPPPQAQQRRLPPRRPASLASTSPHPPDVVPYGRGRGPAVDAAKPCYAPTIESGDRGSSGAIALRESGST
jgi:hypothetical protein